MRQFAEERNGKERKEREVGRNWVLSTACSALTSMKIKLHREKELKDTLRVRDKDR